MIDLLGAFIEERTTCDGEYEDCFLCDLRRAYLAIVFPREQKAAAKEFDQVIRRMFDTYRYSGKPRIKDLALHPWNGHRREHYDTDRRWANKPIERVGLMPLDYFPKVK